MNTPLQPLHEQVIVITGASSGIGLVTAKQAAGRQAVTWRGRSVMLLNPYTGAASRTSARRARVNAAKDMTTSRTATS